jgi:hypothetical protein
MRGITCNSSRKSYNFLGPVEVVAIQGAYVGPVRDKLRPLASSRSFPSGVTKLQKTEAKHRITAEMVARH